MMKYTFALVLLLALTSLTAQEKLDYYLPENIDYNPDIPTPEEVIGHQIGEFHITYDKLMRYMEKLAETSDRVSVEYTGFTHEKQALMLVSFTSGENQDNLEKLRQDHLNSIDPSSNQSRVREEPLVVWLGYTIHGNEASGINAAPLVAYYLAAAEDEDVKEMLDKSIILMDPCLNPDGANRFATWVNSHRSMNNVSDPNSIEFGEAWPGSRSNHYWFDLNRDWLLLQHPESQARIAAFHRWKPHVLTDHHEMGGSSTFFFQPGVPSRANPIVPESNYVLTQKLGMYHAEGLDKIGSLYYTEEVFDDFYLGKGSAYPDVNGSIGILFEQASTRGHLKEPAYGVLPFAHAIRNQVAASFSSFEGAWGIRKELLFNQKEFFKTALDEAGSAAVKGYVFGSGEIPQRTNMMLDILRQHQVEVYPLKNELSAGGVLYKEDEAYVIPCDQMQYRMVRGLMEKVYDYADSTFYDISSWTLPLAMGVPYAELDARMISNLQMEKDPAEVVFKEGELIGDIPRTGYLFTTETYLAHKAIYELLDQGLIMKISTREFNFHNGTELMDFPYGTVFIPVQPQELKGAELHRVMNRTARLNGLKIYSVNTSYTPDGPDLGSGGFSFLKKPNILMLTGGGNRSSSVGQAWFLLDTRFNIPVTLADADRFASMDLSRYNTLILTGSVSGSGGEKLKEWIRGGGNVVAMGSGNSYLRSADVISYERVSRKDAETKDEPKIKPYADRRKDRIGKSIPGSIFHAKLDLTHPLGYGYTNSNLSVFKRSTDFIEPSSNPYANPVYFTDDPLQSGFINDENLDMLKGSVSVVTNSYGRGSVVSFFDDPLFRAYFAGLHKLFMNAVMWGGMM